MSKKDILKKLSNNEITPEEAETMLEEKEVTLKVTPKGCIGIYGLRRMPISLYKEELEKIREKIDDGTVDNFIEENKKLLK
jgi:predicted RNA-binding protein